MKSSGLGHFQPYTVATQSELEEAFQLWLESMQARQFSPNTLRGYRVNVGAFLRYLQENLNLTTLDAVQPHHIRKWLIYRQQHGVSNAQLHNDYRQPRTFWRWCIKEELTTNNPFAKVEKPKPPAKVKPALTPEEVEAILRDKAPILLLLDTGLRIHEAHRLTVADASQETLLIRGKGGKQRVVFLSAAVRLALRKYLQACPFPLQDNSPLW